MKHLQNSIRFMFIMILLTGILYPAGITLVAKVFFSQQANGSILYKDGKRVASKHMAQKFTAGKFFEARPSAGDYGTLASGASNKGPTSADLKKSVEERKAKWSKLIPGKPIPSDLLYASGSGLDPHISVAAAQYQKELVAVTRNLTAEQRKKLNEIIVANTERRTFGVLGEERVNVITLNLALDNILK